MSKFHLSDKGPAPCKATVRDCPIGGEHFDSMGEAERAFERNMKNTHGVFSVKTKATSKKMIAIGGALLSTVSLAACNNSEVMKQANAQMTHDAAVQSSGHSNTPEMSNDEIVPNTGNSTSASSTESDVNESKIQSKIDEKINEYAGKAKDWKKNLKGLEDSLAGGRASNSSTDSAAGDVLFQGKSLKVSKDEVAKAQELLNKMTIVPEHDGSGYNREKQFGKGFKNGVMAKAEHRDFPNATFTSNSLKSRANGGYFIDAYTGQKIQISKESKTDNDIDHVESLKEIYKSGAWAWSQEKRVEYANNLDNIAEVSSRANRSKGDADAANYVPSYEPAQCRYVVKQIEIKANYHLSMDSAEKTATQNILNNKCN